MSINWFFVDYIEQFSYIGIFLMFALAGYVIPVPEEILLLLIGYIAALGFFNVYIAAFASLLGIILGDNMVFWLSKYSRNIIIKSLKKKISKKDIIKYRGFMKSHIGKSIFILRFTPGLRFLSPLLAGSMNVKSKKFFLYNLTAIIIYVPVIIFIGYHFNTQLSMIIRRLKIAKHIIFVLLLAVIGLLISLYANRKSSKQ